MKNKSCDSSFSFHYVTFIYVQKLHNCNPYKLVQITNHYLYNDIWTITHCLGLGHETMVCTVCLSIFLCCCFFFSFDNLYIMIRSYTPLKMIMSNYHISVWVMSFLGYAFEYGGGRVLLNHPLVNSLHCAAPIPMSMHFFKISQFQPDANWSFQ